MKMNKILRKNKNKRISGGGEKTTTTTTTTPKTIRKKKRTTTTTTTRRRRRSTTTRGNKDKDKDILRASLHLLFTYIKDVNKWDDNIDNVVDEYVNVFKKSNLIKGSPSLPPTIQSPIQFPTQIGGGFPFKKYANWIMHKAVGNFDNPCNAIISSIALSTYAIMVYTFVQSMQKHNYDVASATADETYVYSLATPIKYALYHYFPSVHEFQEQIFLIFEEYLRQIFQSFSEKFSITLESQNSTGTIINLLRSLFYDSRLYNEFIVKPVSCVLRYKIKSCTRFC